MSLVELVIELHLQLSGASLDHAFGGALSAEDLALFKLSFGRDKDWVDLRAIVAARAELDVDYIECQLIGMRGCQARSRSMAR